MINMILRLAQWRDVMPHLLCRQAVSGESSQTRFPITEGVTSWYRTGWRKGVLVEWPPVQTERWQLGAPAPCLHLPPTTCPAPESSGSSHTSGVGGLVLSVYGTVQPAMLEVALTVTKDLPRSDFSSDVEKTSVLALIELVWERTCIHAFRVWT